MQIGVTSGGRNCAFFAARRRGGWLPRLFLHHPLFFYKFFNGIGRPFVVVVARRETKPRGESSQSRVEMDALNMIASRSRLVVPSRQTQIFI